MHRRRQRCLPAPRPDILIVRDGWIVDTPHFLESGVSEHSLSARNLPMRLYAGAAALILWCDFSGPAFAQSYQREGSWGVEAHDAFCSALRYDEVVASAIFLVAKPGGQVTIGLLNDEWSTVSGQRYPGLDLFFRGRGGRFIPNLTSTGIEADGLRGHQFVLGETLLDSLSTASFVKVLGRDQPPEVEINVAGVAPTIADLRQCLAEMTSK